MTVIEAVRRAIDEGGWIRQGEDGVWLRPQLMFNRWMGTDGCVALDDFSPRDILDTEWQWTPSEDPNAGDPALVRR